MTHDGSSNNGARVLSIERLGALASEPCLCESTAKGIGCASCWAKDKLERITAGTSKVVVLEGPDPR